MNSNLSFIKELMLRLIIKQHHVNEEQENTGSHVRWYGDAPFVKDEEYQVSEEREHEDQPWNELDQDVLEVSEISV